MRKKHDQQIDVTTIDDVLPVFVDVADDGTIVRMPLVGVGERAVRFVETHEVQDEHRGTARATVYLAGEVYALPEASARHFEARGKAEPV